MEERYDDAIANYARIENWPALGTSALWRLGIAYARAGMEKEALDVIRRMENDAAAKGMSVQSFHLVLINLGLGRDDYGFECLEKAYVNRDVHLPWVKHPLFDPYKSDPRYQAVLRKMKLND